MQNFETSDLSSKLVVQGLVDKLKLNWAEVEAYKIQD